MRWGRAQAPQSGAPAARRRVACAVCGGARLCAAAAETLGLCSDLRRPRAARAAAGHALPLLAPRLGLAAGLAALVLGVTGDTARGVSAEQPRAWPARKRRGCGARGARRGRARARGAPCAAAARSGAARAAGVAAATARASPALAGAVISANAPHVCAPAAPRRAAARCSDGDLKRAVPPAAVLSFVLSPSGPTPRGNPRGVGSLKVGSLRHRLLWAEPRGT
jgi:hypothetical protein